MPRRFTIPLILNDVTSKYPNLPIAPSVDERALLPNVVYQVLGTAVGDWLLDTDIVTGFAYVCILFCSRPVEVHYLTFVRDLEI